MNRDHVVCPFCWKQAGNLQAVLRHIMEVHSDVEVGPGNRVEGTLNNHPRWESGTVRCWCGELYAWPSRWIEHIEAEGLVEHILACALRGE